MVLQHCNHINQFMLDIEIMPEFHRFGFILVDGGRKSLLSSLDKQIYHVEMWTQKMRCAF